MKLHPEDRDFLTFRARGDADALARVFDALAPRLLLLASHLARDAASAEDLVQTTFLQALRDASGYDGRRPLVHWLSGILAHRARDERRRSRVRAASPLDPERERSLVPEPLELATERDSVERITAAIEGLGEPYRQVLVLRAVHGLTPTEIAHALGRAPGTVRMQLQRAREKLREALPQEIALPALFLADDGRGLASVREAVLAEASGAAAGAGAGIAAGSSWGFSAAGIALAGVAVIVGAVLWGTQAGSDPDTSVASASPRAPDPPGREPPQLEIVEPQDLPGKRTALEPTAQDETPLAARPAVAGVTVVGSVLDLRGNPVPGAVIFGADVESHTFLAELCRTGAAGEFTLENAQPGLHLAARARGLQPSSFGRKRGAVQVQGESGETMTVLLRLGADGQRLSGTVVDPLGTPVGDAWLAIAVDEDARGQPEGMPVPRGEPKVDRETCWVRADGSGRFATDEVPAGAALIVARPDDPAGELVSWKLVNVIAGAANRVDFALEPGAEVSGRVVDTDGRAVEGLRVESVWKGSDELGELEDELGPMLVDRRVHTAADGSFRLAGLLPGEHEVLVRGGARALASTRVELARGERRAWDVVVDVQAALAVRVLGPDGSALAGWGLAWKTGVRARDSQLERDIRMPVALDGEGRFRIESMDLRAHTLRVFTPPDAWGSFSRLACAERTGVLPGPGEFILQLGSRELPTASLTGTWIDERGLPLAGASVWLECADSFVAGAGTDEQGRFRFEHLPAGEFELLANAPERYARGTLLARAALAPGAAQDAGVLALPDAARLSVELAAEDGRPITRPELELITAGASGELRLDRATGLFRSDWVAPGQHVLVISGEDLAPTRRTIDVWERETSVTITCPRGHEVLFDFVLLHEGELESPAYAGGGRIDLELRDARDEVVFSERDWKPFTSPGERVVRWSLWLPSGAFRALAVDHTWEREGDRPRPAATFAIPDAEPLAPIRVEIR